MVNATAGFIEKDVGLRLVRLAVCKPCALRFSRGVTHGMEILPDLSSF